jgi:hypothetical protein
VRGIPVEGLPHVEYMKIGIDLLQKPSSNHCALPTKEISNKT